MKIAFGYKMGAGKDTCADYIIKNKGGIKLSFSHPLYDILEYAQKMCGFSTGKDRQFLQMIGTWARDKNPDVWIDLFKEKVQICRSEYEHVNIVNSDVRFLNEFESLKKQGFTMIKIKRTLVDSSRAGTGSSYHISEMELDSLNDDSWDFVIDNDGSLDDLYVKLDNICRG